MNRKLLTKLSPFGLLAFALLATSLLFLGCSNGSDGANGISTGTITGTVTDTFNNKVANATITPSPAVDSLPGGNVSTAAETILSSYAMGEFCLCPAWELCQA